MKAWLSGCVVGSMLCVPGIKLIHWHDFDLRRAITCGLISFIVMSALGWIVSKMLSKTQGGDR